MHEANASTNSLNYTYVHKLCMFWKVPLRSEKLENAPLFYKHN